MSKHKKSVNWTAIFVGFAVLMTSIAVFENLGKPQYIHPVGILGGVIASVLLVQAKRYGKRPWFWLSIALVATLHVPLVIFIAESGKQISSGLVVALGILDAIVIAFVNVSPEFVVGWFKEEVFRWGTRSALAVKSVFAQIPLFR